MLHIENITIEFDGHVVVEGIDLRVASREMVCVTGKSGSGKSALLRAILGFISFSKGSIQVDGLVQTPQTIDAIRRKIAWMPQELFLPCEWVKDMVRLPFQLKANKDSVFSEQQLIENLELLGLSSGLLQKRVSEVSGGERQRIMLAVSAMLSKKIILLDEPTSALDSASCCKVVEFFIWD